MESGMGRRNERVLAIVRVLAQVELVQPGLLQLRLLQLRLFQLRLFQLEGGCSICAFIRSSVEFI